MNQFAVEYNAGELGVGGLLAGRVETRGDKLDFERLPLSGGLSGINARRHDPVDVMVARFFLGARVDTAAGIAAQVFGLVRVQNLNLVATHQLHASVRLFWNRELQLHVDVLVILSTFEIRRIALANEHAATLPLVELFWRV